MIRRKTVFFVGAGASAEAGLPIGHELKTNIAHMLSFETEFGMRISGSGDGELFDMLRIQSGSEFDTYLTACRLISRGLVNANSIDDFIHNFQHDKAIALCGKVAIAKAILDAEYASRLYFDKTDIDSTINFNEVDDTWYSAFYNLLTQGVPKGNLATIFDNVTVVCFNYDRCIEHYLVHALINHYSMHFSEALALVERLVIHRPYGSVGSYFDRTNAFTFGSRHYPSIAAITSSLRTYTENVNTNKEPASMLAAINEAEIHVYLGMAFHPNNMELLHYKGDGSTSVPKQIYATRCGYPEAAIPIMYAAINRVISSKSNDTRSGHIHHGLIIHKCADLFTEYGVLLRS